MNNLALTLIICVFTFSMNSWGQQSHSKCHKKHHFNHNHNTNFMGGVLAGFFLNELFEFGNKSKHMYFSYKPHKNTWRLEKEFYRIRNPFEYNKRVVARFENPHGRDFYVTINKHGEWAVNCPKRFKKTLKNKVRRHL